MGVLGPGKISLFRYTGKLIIIRRIFCVVLVPFALAIYLYLDTLKYLIYVEGNNTEALSREIMLSKGLQLSIIF